MFLAGIFYSLGTTTSIFVWTSDKKESSRMDTLLFLYLVYDFEDFVVHTCNNISKPRLKVRWTHIAYNFIQLQSILETQLVKLLISCNIKMKTVIIQ